MPRLQHIDFRHRNEEARRRLLDVLERHQQVEELLANLDVMVVRPGMRRWLSQSSRKSELLPVRVGDLIRIEVGLNRPAYVYLVWISANHPPLAIYPWEEADWDKRKTLDVPVSRLELPEADEQIGWPVERHSCELETVLLLVRDEPLPKRLDLRQHLSELPEDNIADPSACFVLDSRRRVRVRTVNLKRPRRVIEPQLQLHEELLRRFGHHCELVLATTFLSRDRKQEEKNGVFRHGNMLS
jgi:hypothetical protein